MITSRALAIRPFEQRDHHVAIDAVYHKCNGTAEIEKKQ